MQVLKFLNKIILKWNLPCKSNRTTGITKSKKPKITCSDPDSSACTLIMTTPKLDDTLEAYNTDLELVSSRLIFSAFSSRLIFSSSVTLSSSESGMYLSGISTLLGTYSYTQKQAVSTNSFNTCRRVSITLCDSVCNYF